MHGVKIIATVGPSCDTAERIESMAVAGMTAIRVNTAHVEKGYISRISGILAGANKKLGTRLSLIVDLKGPELRTDVFPGGSLAVSKGTSYLVGRDKESDIPVNMPDALANVAEGDPIIMGDGAVRLAVTGIVSKGVRVNAVNSGVLRSRSRINVPGKLLDLGSVTERDISYIKEGCKSHVGFYALSFVQSRQDVIKLSGILQSNGSDAEIISKIETQKGLENLHSIAPVSDWIMVARGDLGVEVPLHEVAIEQKSIIHESHRYGVPAIVATQMLESMTENPSPTRAEVADVTNAILDNTDALMLSEETAIGKYPLDAVRYLREISDFVESGSGEFPEPVSFMGNRVAYSIARASKVISREIGSHTILAFTKSGSTARMISAVRPGARIVAAVTDSDLACRLSLLRGVEPVVVPEEFSKGKALQEAVEYLQKIGTLALGERVVVTSGSPYFLFGGTTDVRVITSGRFIGRGYASGKSIRGRITSDPHGKGEILLATGREELDLMKKFKAVLFESRVSAGVRDTLAGVGITVVGGTRLATQPEDGSEVFIDAETGVILASSP